MKPHLFIKVKREYIKINLEELVSVEAVSKQETELTCIKDSYRTKMPLEYVASYLPASLFTPVSSLCYVSLGHIVRFDDENILMSNKKIVKPEAGFKTKIRIEENL